MELRKTVLHSWHVKHGGKMVNFAGFEMPVQYEAGARKEHLAVRTSSGLFDISHMGRYLINCKSEAAISEYEKLITSPVAAMEPGSGSYGLLCKEDGGILDDIFNFRLDESRWLLVVNAANRQKDMDWLMKNGPSIDITDVSEKIAMLALQGPESLRLLRKAGYSSRVDSIPERNSISDGALFKDGIFTRTGYTGEDGVEIYVPADRAEALADLLLTKADETGIRCLPCGLASRDSLRFEPGYPLYGHELTEDITPREALLKWACKLNSEEPDFIGKTAIQERYEQKDDFYRLRTVKLLEKGMPRQDMKVVDKTGEELGWVASGMASPSLDGFFANIFIRKSSSQIGNEVYIEIRNSPKKAEIVKRPIYKAL